MKTRIHVNQHVIKANQKGKGKIAPPLTVKNRLGNEKTFEVGIRGPSKVVYSPDKPLPCGATCWVETDSDVEPGTQARYVRTPEVQVSFFLVPHGYQCDILVNGKLISGSCRDFGGDNKIKDLQKYIIAGIENLCDDMRKKF